VVKHYCGPKKAVTQKSNNQEQKQQMATPLRYGMTLPNGQKLCFGTPGAGCHPAGTEIASNTTL
jgi:hypothetical protein